MAVIVLVGTQNMSKVLIVTVSCIFVRNNNVWRIPVEPTRPFPDGFSLNMRDREVGRHNRMQGTIVESCNKCISGCIIVRCWTASCQRDLKYGPWSPGTLPSPISLELQGDVTFFNLRVLRGDHSIQSRLEAAGLSSTE
jgi:hypothetical protein